MHARTLKQARTHACTSTWHTCTHTHTLKHARTHANKHTHTSNQTQRRTYEQTPLAPHVRVITPTGYSTCNIRTYTHMYSHTRTHTHTTHTHTHTPLHTYARVNNNCKHTQPASPVFFWMATQHFAPVVLLSVQIPHLVFLGLQTRLI